MLALIHSRPTRRDFLTLSGAIAASAFLNRRAPAQPATAALPKPRFIDANGIRIAVYEQGEGFPIVFSHGFPELAYSWRHQLPALANAGFHAIAPDQRGYGLTSIPEKVEDYDIHKLTGDLIGILDAMKIEKAVFCGHDWGGMVVWMTGVLHPDRTAGVIGVNTPFIPRSPIKPIQMLTQMRGEDNYIVAFQAPGVADAALAKDVHKTFTMFMRKGGGMNAEEFAKLPADAPERKFQLLKMLERDEFPGELLMSEEELNYYVETFERTGFTGGINWYRNMDRNWETTSGVEYKINVPCMYIGAEDDVVLPPSMANGMEQWVPDLEKHVIADCGHWTQQQKPEELNALLVDFMKRKFA